MMTVHKTYPRLAVFVLAISGISLAAQAQIPQELACRRAADFLSNTASAASPATTDGKELAELRQEARVRLVTCGPIAGEVAARAIRVTRNETDTDVLGAEVSGYANLRDSAVLGAALEVAQDASASVPARLHALRTLWVQDTGKYWVAYDWMARRESAMMEVVVGRCDSGVRITDAYPFWYEGAPLPNGSAQQIRDVAARLWKDTAQPEAIRSAASCVLRR